MDYCSLRDSFPELVPEYSADIQVQIELQIKYAGYICRQANEVEKLGHIESIRVPRDLDYHAIQGLRTEAKLRLTKALPDNLGQASRIPGIAPSDISVLMIALSRPSYEDIEVNNCGCG
jgi:tRNA uridine 5-carboxymethylaminomethyl modification enzyme